MVVLLGVVSIFGINFVVLGPPLARDILHADVSGYGLLMSAFGAGALASAVGIAMLGSRPGTMAVAATSLGVSLIALANSSFLPLSLVLMALAGFGVVGTKTLVRADFHKDVGTRVMRQSTLAMLAHGYAVSITVIAGTEDEVEELIDGLSFSTPGR